MVGPQALVASMVNFGSGGAMRDGDGAVLEGYLRRPVRPDQISLSPQEILALLIEGGLVVDDEATALAWIEAVGYFHLKGYLEAFRKNGNFGEATLFEHVLELLKWERSLRSILLTQLGNFELRFKVALVAIIGQGSGTGYLEWSNFQPGLLERWKKILTQVLDREVLRGQERFIESFNVPDDLALIPLWRLVEVMSFGEVINLYICLDAPHRSAVAQRMANPDECGGMLTAQEFDASLFALRDFRNLAAHFRVLFDKEFWWFPSLSEPNRRLSQSVYFADVGGVLRTFDVITLLMYFESTLERGEDPWRSEVADLLQRAPTCKANITGLLGAPSDWFTRPYWSMGTAPTAIANAPRGHSTGKKMSKREYNKANREQIQAAKKANADLLKLQKRNRRQEG